MAVVPRPIALRFAMVHPGVVCSSLVLVVHDGSRFGIRLQKRSASLSMPDHQTFVRNRCFVPTIPRYPLCPRVTTACRSILEKTILVPLNTSFPILHSSAHMGIYSLYPVICLQTSVNSSSSLHACSTSLVSRLLVSLLHIRI